MSELQAAFDNGQYQDLITALTLRPPQAIREFRLFGLALLRSGRFPEAETPLTRAAVLGDAEAQVELGNLLRLLGRFEEASAHFGAIEGTLTGELRLRALRWWGVAEFQAGSATEGLRRCERAWHGYLALGDDALTARVTQSLAEMHTRIGDHGRAMHLYKEAVLALPAQPVPFPRLTALTGLLNLQLEVGDFGGAEETLGEARATLRFTDSPRPRALLLATEAELRRLTGKYMEYALALEDLRATADESQDFDLRMWVASRLAEHYSLRGLHGKALEVLYAFGRASEWPPALRATSGILARRRGQYAEALRDLGQAADTFRERGRVPELIRALLHLAAAAHRARNEEQSVAALGEALREMLHLRHQVAFRPDLEELSELLHHAVLEPELAPYLEPVLDNLANLAGSPRLPEDGLMRVQVTTLGRVAVSKNGAEVALSLRGSAVLLAYLALRPGRTRAQIQLDLYPDKDASTGAGYVRSAIKELRDALGQEVIVFEGPHNAPRYSLGGLVHVDLDLTHFQEALSRGEVSRALALYRGPFMPGVEDCEWAQHKREEALLALTFELRNQMARYRAEGDLRRLILMANQYLRADPYDQEVLEARVEAARAVAPPQELARYVAELHRNYN